MHKIYAFCERFFLNFGRGVIASLAVKRDTPLHALPYHFAFMFLHF